MGEVKDSFVAKKPYDFALELIRVTKFLAKTYENIIIIKQVLRSATSIGANIEEALGSNSKKEFIHSMNIAKKEARETLYWLKLLKDCNKNREEQLMVLIDSDMHLVNMLTKIVKTSSGKLSTYNL